MPKRKPKRALGGAQLRAARIWAGKTQKEVAEEIGLPRGQTDVSEIERHDKSIKQWQIIEDFRRAVGMT